MSEICVIVPVYKVEPFLHRCIDSILVQTFSCFELILVDDGSPDCCGEICDSYAQSDSRVHVIHQPNGGLSAARNAGIDWAFAHSDGKWITFIDSDDWVAPNYLEVLFAAVQNDKTAIAIGAYLETDGKYLPTVEDKKSVVWEPADYYMRHAVNATVAWGKLYYINCLDEIRFPVGKLHEDEYVTYRILFQQERISVIDAPIYAYYQNKNGIMGSRWTVKRLDALEALEQQVAFFLQHGYIGCAQIRFKSLGWNIVNAHEQIEHCDKLTKNEKKRYFHQLSLQLRRLLKEYRQYHWVSIKNRGIDLHMYRYAYKSVYILHLFWKAFKTVAFKPPLMIKNGIIQLCHVVRYRGCLKDKQVVLLQTPLHENLGDHAIALSEMELLKNRKIACMDFPWSAGIEGKCAAVSGKRTICVTGGGWMGSLWPNEEQRLRDTLSAYKKQRVVVFPQTVYFDMNTQEGRACFEASKASYEAHPNLTIFLRERFSYDFMRENMPNVRVELAPDIAMLLKPELPPVERRGALLCLRGDKERTASESARAKLVEAVKERYPGARFTDTVLPEPVGVERREQAVRDKLAEFAAAKLVVTDRLHGMIFAAITETPCVVVDSLSPKLRGCYAWLDDLDYIRFAENIDAIPAIMQELERVKPKYNRARIEAAMAPLYQELTAIKDKKRRSKL